MSGRESNIVGIFSRSSKEDYSWLVELLTSEYFRKTIREVRPCYISNNGFQQFMDDLSQCTFGILYHTKNRGRINITDVTSSLYDEELENLNITLGKDGVIVLIDDLKESGNWEKIRILENQPSVGKLASDLLLISHTEKADRIQLVRKLKSVKQLCHPLEHPEHPHKVDLVPQTSKSLNTCSEKTSASRRFIIGIFSVSEEDHINWLRRLLSLDIFGQREVTYHKIPSYDNVGLEDGKLQCVVAILYHTMKTGPAVTPQGEFLYHKVTDQLVQKLGKDNVIVLIDDLRSYRDKKWAMWVQSRIERWAGDLLYFLQEEKHNQQLLVQKLKSLKLFRQPPEYHPKSDPIQPTSGTINKTPTSRRSIIGIFSVSEEGHINWLRRLLSLDIFGQREVTYHKITSYDNVGLDDGKLQCVVAILYHTMKTGPAVTSQGEFLYHKVTDQLVQKLGKDNVIVLIDDLQNYADKKWAMCVQSKIERWAGDLLYFLQEEKHNQHLLVQRLKSLKVFRQTPEYHPKADPIQPTSGTLNTISAPASSVIGVFSRSEKSKCSWLKRLLSYEEFGNHQVIFHQISPGNMKEFQFLVSLCKFGILYHCMDRGYQYLTDQKNSLYDEELLYLSSTLGKSRVIVVMDELGNSDEEAKCWTLENQPSLGMLARDVLLFSKLEKSHQEESNRRMPADRNLGTVYEKLNTLKENLKEGMTSESFSS